MKVRFKDYLLLLTAETEEEQRSLAEWASERAGHVFALHQQDERTSRLVDLGPRGEACREPINITSRAVDPGIRLLSNLANTPFELDGETYASVEAFWQGLKFVEPERRRAIAGLHGQEARHAGFGAPDRTELEYRGERVRAGTAVHWRLMSAACLAKFTQHAEARAALLATGDRPLEHKTRRDSESIPGVVMASIWMRIRAALRAETARGDS